ncbi:uncharacterized protein [Lolium perenne]|uniref:uncharacterized protein n=1 Tax=Lolium perenne TaxID=4522 RepID=UPI003A993524
MATEGLDDSASGHGHLLRLQKKVEPFIRFRSTRMCMVGKRANMTSSARISRSDSGDQRPRARVWPSSRFTGRESNHHIAVRGLHRYQRFVDGFILIWVQHFHGPDRFYF